MNNSYISSLDKIDAKYHRSRVIFHLDYQWHFGDFDNMNQIQRLADILGFEFSLDETKTWFSGGTYCKYSINRKIHSPCDGGFWKRGDVPQEAKPIKALSNGSIVTCYYTNDGETIRIYRPNPNAKEVYNPLTTSQHIEHVKEYGCY